MAFKVRKTDHGSAKRGGGFWGRKAEAKHQGRRVQNNFRSIEDAVMRAHYDFSKMKGKKNPYLSRLKAQKIVIQRVAGLWKDRITLRTQADVNRLLRQYRGSTKRRLKRLFS